MWDRIAGQPRAVATLRGAVETGRVAHAYLFVGPAGVGRRSTARVFAASLVCRQRPPCGSCSSCRRILNLTHPDFNLLTTDGATIGIDQVRQVQRRAALKPYEAARQIYVIDPADAMTEQAQNALLKVLEEPPGTAVFILLATGPETVLPTIQSRCQVIRFLRLSTEYIAGQLTNRGVAPEKARVVAALADGSLGWALREESVELLTVRERVVSWLQELHTKRERAFVSVGEAMESEKEWIQDHLLLAGFWYRDLMAVHAGLPESTLYNMDLKPQLTQAVATISMPGAASALFEVEKARRLLQTPANFRLVIDQMLVNICKGLRTA